jgi:hypothetical protein
MRFRAQAGATLGVLSTARASATMLAPSLGGVMVPAFGRRSMIALKLPLIVLALAIVMRTLTEPAAPRPRRHHSMQRYCAIISSPHASQRVCSSQ